MIEDHHTSNAARYHFHEVSPDAERSCSRWVRPILTFGDSDFDVCTFFLIYNLSYTLTSLCGCPDSCVPIAVMVSVFPSGEIWYVRFSTSLPFFL